jgi:hypothetical protein
MAAGRVTASKAEAELALMAKRVDLGTAAGVKKIQQVTKSSIKSGMRGRPRWDHRGASRRTGEAVNLRLNPPHVSKGGGPGKLSGSLAKSIRASKKPRPTEGGFSGVVMSGGAGGPQNLYKRQIESKYPYFVPGVNRAKPKMPAIWHAAWEKATQTKR